MYSTSAMEQTKNDMPNEMNGSAYQYLESRPGSASRVLFVKGRRIGADVLYGDTVGEDASSVDEVAENYGVTVETVLEAIHYCRHNEELLTRDSEQFWAELSKAGLNQPPYVPVARRAGP